MIKFKDLNKESQKEVKEDWEKNPINYDEELDENQLIMIDEKEKQNYTKK